MIRVLVSACLLGERVRHNGEIIRVEHPALARWQREGRVVPVCPEVAGGLPVPRPPAEIRGHSVVDRNGRDVSAQFAAGARHALAFAREHGVRVAVLKEHSPSCGLRFVHDGTFCGRLVPGPGFTAALLRDNGVAIFTENEIDAADAEIRRFESANLGQ